MPDNTSLHNKGDPRSPMGVSKTVLMQENWCPRACVNSVCGFCGGTACQTSVVKGSAGKAPFVASSCPLMWPRTKCYLGAMVKQSASNPCTNAPTRCPLCPSGTFYVWLYAMPVHYAKYHSGNSLPDDLKVSVEELSKVVKSAAKKAQGTSRGGVSGGRR
jgi:hypothetical protein